MIERNGSGMSDPRFFCEESLHGPGEWRLPDRLAHHAVRVLRLHDGADVILFDGSGRQAKARLVRRAGDWWARVAAPVEVSRESRLQVVLVQALPAGDKMDWVVQKSVELGVAAIQPVRAARSLLKLSGERAERRLEHWRQVAIAACEQSGRNRVPEVHPIVDLQHYLGADCPRVRRLLLDPQGGVRLAAVAAPAGLIHVLIGPEGGWRPDELAACRTTACESVTLGPRVLRSETAGLAALAAMQALWGDF